MEENINISEEQVINSPENVGELQLIKVVVDAFGYLPLKDILVKPMDAIKVKKLVNRPVATEELDEDGKPLMEMKEEEVEVESIFREGIVLALPIDSKYPEMLKVGDRIVFNYKFNTVPFDLLKDSILIKPYDILFTNK